MGALGIVWGGVGLAGLVGFGEGQGFEGGAVAGGTEGVGNDAGAGAVGAEAVVPGVAGEGLVWAGVVGVREVALGAGDGVDASAQVFAQAPGGFAHGRDLLNAGRAG